MGLSVLPCVIFMELKKDIKKANRNVKKWKPRVIIPLLVILTGFFVYTTADLTKEVTGMFFGSVAGFSLLTIIFFVANMLKDVPLKEAVKPYVAVFGLLLIWSVIFALLRLFFNF